MANRGGHRRFGNVRRRESGRYQIRYPGPDGRMRTGPETYERKSDADRALVMIEAQIRSGEWTDPDRGKVKLGDYGSAWITERPGLRPRTMDLYRWLLRKHIEPYLGGIPVGKLSTRQIREWRANLLANGVSVSVTAKAYRLLRAIMTTAVEDDKLLPRNPCRIRGAGTEDAGERPIVTVAQVFELPGRSDAARSATSARSPVATGSASAAMARCAHHRRCTAHEPKPNEPCGRWPATAGPTATMTGGSTPWCSSPPSRACAGARRRRSGDAIST
jgi:hypothetical protein